VVHRIFKLLDSRFLSRVGNAEILLRLAGLLGLLALGVLATIAPILTSQWWPFAVWLTASVVILLGWRQVTSARRADQQFAAQPLPERQTLTRLIRLGTEIMSEANMEASQAAASLGAPSDEQARKGLDAVRDREAEWTNAVENFLANRPELDRFCEAHGFPAPGFYAVHNRVKARLRVLREIAHELERPGQSTPSERLNAALSDGIVPRTRVTLRPDEGPPFDEDPLFCWAKRTHDLLRKHFPGYADDFFGEDFTLGPAYFGMGFTTKLEDLGRAGYLEGQIALLKQIALQAPRAIPDSTTGSVPQLR